MGYGTVNHLINSIDQLDMNTITMEEVRFQYGTFRPYSTGSGRDKKHFSRSGVATPIGDIREDLWYEVTEQIAKRDGELWLVDALVQWNTEHNYGKNDPKERRRSALETYSYRSFDNPGWVLYIPFNRRYRPLVLETARLVTIVSDCCKEPKQVTQEQIDRAQADQISCPVCGRWNTFSILSEEIPPWDVD